MHVSCVQAAKYIYSIKVIDFQVEQVRAGLPFRDSRRPTLLVLGASSCTMSTLARQINLS